MATRQAIIPVVVGTLYVLCCPCHGTKSLDAAAWLVKYIGLKGAFFRNCAFQRTCAIPLDLPTGDANGQPEAGQPRAVLVAVL